MNFFARLVLPAGFLALAVADMGCYATVRTRPAYYDGYAVVYDDSAPYDVYSYPRYTHNGRYVYLVGDRWYYQTSWGWAYYRDEPPALWHHRRSYYYTYGYSAPPAYGAPPAHRVYSAPPAYGAPPAYAPPPPAAPPPAYAPPPPVGPAPAPPPPAPKPMYAPPPPIGPAPAPPPKPVAPPPQPKPKPGFMR